MSTKAYSNDLRKRVIEYVKEGNTQVSAAEIFKISKSVVNAWWKRYRETGSCESKPKLGSKGKINQEELENYVESNPGLTLKEIGAAFQASGTAIFKRFKKAGFKYKKKRLHTWKQTQKRDPNT